MCSAAEHHAVLDVVDQVASRDGPRRKFADLLLGITALDDVWALLLFGIGLALVKASQGDGVTPWVPLLWVSRELLGGALLGVALGIPAAILTGRIRDGQPILLEALGIVLLCGGLAQQLEVSYLVASIAMGAVVANLAQHHEYPFHAIEGIELPFMALFFVLAGASMDLAGLAQISAIGVAYIVLRCVGKVVGASAGAGLTSTDVITRRWVGVALLPQAGVAIGMGLVALEQLGASPTPLLTIVISSTVVFELGGPPLVRLALCRFRDLPG